MSARRERSPGRWTPVLAGLSALLVLGCALTTKSEPLVLRYFSPERPGEVREPARPPAEVAPELRLGHVTGASHLDERVAYRDSEVEVGYYQERRWTEEPGEYLRRRLALVLFERRGLRHVVGGAAPTLEVELTAFEEIRRPTRLARVQVSVRLQDARLVRWEETLTVEQPIPLTAQGDVAAETALALGVALSAVVERIADRVTTELARGPVPSR